ncbi:MAG TPA: polysaccharide biosynthesis/export family protein, partial [Flavobacteriales bacterium]|nr:polysaccharide biosynthesis/export family protein [Flavobacteriales bacterium]
DRFIVFFSRGYLSPSFFPSDLQRSGPVARSKPFGTTLDHSRMKFITPFLAIVVVATLSSCVGRRSVNYLQDPALSNTAKLFPNSRFQYRVQVNDVLSIRVLGLDDATGRLFNIDQNNNNALSDAAIYVNGFSVDKTGHVQLPSVGKLKVQGLTLSEAEELVQRRINDIFTNATVILKLVSFRVSVLGSVNAPGSYLIYNNQITLLDALARAGGPQEYADKHHVTLMRQSDQGTQAVYVDLSRADVASSEYYYLLPNDVVYVPSLKARPQRMNLELLGILFSAISAAAIVVTVVQNSNK